MLPAQLLETEGIKYAGSKRKLLPHIAQIVSDLDVSSVLDGFSGSTRVSQLFSQLGYNTIASDRSAWSEVLGQCYLLNTHPPEHYLPLLLHLNKLPGYDGWFTEHYGGDVGEPIKRPFQRKNTRRLDAIRDEIDRLALSNIERAVLLTSLMLALDSVDNTLGHFVSYLSGWSARSYRDLTLRLPKIYLNAGQHTVLREDIFTTLQNQRFDLAYFDPPYGSNNEKMPPSRVRYNAYYHLWTTLVLHDKPAVFGKANRREDSRDLVDPSPFEDYRSDEQGHSLALQALTRLIHKTQARYILLSYSSGGRATWEELHDRLAEAGTIRNILALDHKRHVMSHMRWTEAWIQHRLDQHQEYLFLLEKHHG
ncbi:MAG: DNA methyltransferase [Pseudomonadales bacterium]|nr:DNA methyltransferase [Pseudomonadales bacterium]